MMRFRIIVPFLYFLLMAPAYAGTIDLSFTDKKRERNIPLRVHLPDETKPVPVILFSHGLGGSREGYIYVGHDWSARGYAVIMMQHAGSDETVWKDKGKIRAVVDMKRAASAQNLIDRAQDVSATIDQLQNWDAQKDHPLYRRLDLSRIGMSGHSFGASTTQAVAGQVYKQGNLKDPRIKAFLAMSPSIPQRESPQEAFGAIQSPFLLMTGTQDESPIRPMSPEERMQVFEGLPQGDKYQILFDGATHMTFSQRKVDTPRDYQPAILKLSGAFWDAYLKDNVSAKTWLQKNAAEALEPGDVWQTK